MKRHIIIIVFFFLLSGCKKSGGSIYDCALSPSFLEGGYELVGATKNNLDILYNSAYFASCRRDDILTIFADEHYTITENMDSCSPSRYEFGHWTLQDSIFSMDNQVFVINDFSCIGFKLRYTEVVAASQVNTYVFSYIKR